MVAGERSLIRHSSSCIMELGTPTPCHETPGYKEDDRPRPIWAAQQTRRLGEMFRRNGAFGQRHCQSTHAGGR